MATPSDPDLPYRKIGEYEITARIGVGGMGVVYEGRQPLIGKRVAVKVLMPAFSTDQELVERFTAEARAVNEIRHRGIVDIFSFGKLPDGSHYFVMEYLEGEPFDRLIKRRGPMPIAEVLGWVDEVLDALDAAHDAGIIHRDIKPSNLFLVNPGRGRSYVKLLDFGIAKLGVSTNSDTPQTRASVILGTPDYISPEQARGQAISSRTDLYAVGVVLFELLTGERPFQGENSLATMWMHVDDHAPRASDVRPDLPAQIDELILWAMEKDPAKRPQSAEDMRAHVQSIRAAMQPAAGAMTPPPPTRDSLPQLSVATKPMPSPLKSNQRTSAPSPMNLPTPMQPRRPSGHLNIPAASSSEAKVLSNETRLAPLPIDEQPRTTLDRPSDILAAVSVPKMFGDTDPGAADADSAAEQGSIAEVPTGREFAMADASAEPEPTNSGYYDGANGDQAADSSGNGALIAVVVVLLVLVAIAGVLLVQELKAKTPENDVPSVPLSTVQKLDPAKPVPPKETTQTTQPATPAPPKPQDPTPQQTPTPSAAPVDPPPPDRQPDKTTAVQDKKVDKPVNRGVTREQLESRMARLERKLATRESQTGEPDQVTRMLLAQARKMIADAQSDADRREASRSLDDLSGQLDGH